MKGILFKPLMRQAIKKGHKSITRRLDGLKEINLKPNNWELIGQDKSISSGKKYFVFVNSNGIEMREITPRYKVDDIVYIKEAHYCYGYWIKNGKTKTGKQQWLFRATGRIRFLDNPPAEIQKNSYKDKTGWFKRSPLFLPARFARDFIKVLDVKPIRLLPISDEEAIKESITILGRPELNDLSRGEFAYAFRNLWDGINPKYPSSFNPYVWRIGFEFLKDYKKEN